jgi:hypothetical protein
MGKEWLKEEITFWKEMFSLFSKTLILMASAVIVDIKANNEISNIDYIGMLGIVSSLLASAVALAQWRKHITTNI